MEICSSTSLINLSQRITTDLRGGKVVFFHIPPVGRAEQWEEELLAACSQKGGAPLLVTLSADNPAPEPSLQQSVDQDAKSIEESLLRGPFCDSHIVVSVTFDKEMSVSWQRFLGKLERLYERGSDEGSLRGLLFFFHGGYTATSKPSPATKHFYLWNALRWEDMRCLGLSWLDGETSNPLMRAWQVSSYAGAANGDPFLLREICSQVPRSLSEINVSVRAKIASSPSALPPERMITPRAESRWDVPDSSLNEWREGKLLGITLERGPQVPWEQIPSSDLEAFGERLIWQEQVTSLLPTILELTWQTGKWISRHLSPDWEKNIVEENDSLTAVEPSKILQVFARNNKLGRLPDSIYRLLNLLREARNSLAHLSPIDASIIDKIWSAYCIAQDRFDK
jgi:hypothetical protein